MSENVNSLEKMRRRNLIMIGATAVPPCLATLITVLIAGTPEALFLLIPYSALHLVVWGLAIPAFETYPLASWLFWTFILPFGLVLLVVTAMVGFDGIHGWWGLFALWTIHSGAMLWIWLTQGISSTLALLIIGKDRKPKDLKTGHHFITRMAYKLFG